MSRNKSDHYRRTIDPVQEDVIEDPTVIPVDSLLEQESGQTQKSEEESIYPVITSLPSESPIEEKIHQLVDAVPLPPIDGWGNDMLEAPIDGSRVMVSETGKDQGVLVYWRISRAIDRKNLRYVSRGRWTDFLSKIDISFAPKYWKPYDPEEYWPLQGGAA